MRMTIAEKVESRKRKTPGRLTWTACRILQDKDRMTGAAFIHGHYDYSRDPNLIRCVEVLLANPGVRHIDIPRRAAKMYSEGE